MVNRRIIVESDVDWNAVESIFIRSPKRMKQLSEIILKEVESYVPYRTGRTTKSGRAYPGYLIYKTPYVDYIYTGKHMKFNRMYHTNATYEWVSNGYAERKTKISKRIQKEIFRK